MSDNDLTPAHGAGGEQRIFCLALCCAAAVLLALIAHQTRWIDGLRLAAQPRMLPLVSLLGLVAFSAAAAMAVERVRPVQAAALLSWLRPAEYMVYFLAYASLVGLAGYGLSTIAFCVLLAARAGCTRNQALAAGAAGLAIVAIFKGLLAVKIPGAPWYGLFPDPVASFLILNF